MIKILIVDDSNFMRSSIKRILTTHKFSVVGEANNGKLAVEKYKECKPDIVTLDVTMGEMSGLEALKEIISYDADAKVIMVSSMGQKPIILEAINAGAKDFLVKPFDETRVVSTLLRHAPQRLI